MANSLKLGCDCLGEIKYFDGISVDSHGNPLTIENAMCMHEEDDSILWKHFDFREGTAETRRSRKLVISFIATVANYEYAFYWHLFLDGSIEFLVKATGILSTAGQNPGENNPYGQKLNNDGLSTHPPTHVQRPHGLRTRRTEERRLRSGHGNPRAQPHPHRVQSRGPAPGDRTGRPSARPTLPSTASGKSPTRENQNLVNEPVAYRLIPTNGIQLAAGDESYVSQRAQFARNNLWVTAYDRTERFAAGEYPNQATGADDGLHIWTQPNRNI